MTRISVRLSSVAASVLLAAASWAVADPAQDVVSTRAIPGGVVDVAGTTGFVSNADRNIVAVDLANGKEKWKGPRGDFPAAVVGDRVLVLNADAHNPNVLRLFVFDTSTGGKAVLQSDPIVFPAWVDPRPGDDWAFGLLPRVEGGDLWLRYRARAARKTATGAVHIDMKSGKVEMLAADKMPPSSPPPLALSAALTKQAQRDYETPAGPDTRVLTAGPFAVAVDVQKQRVILRRWDAATEKEQDPVTLAQGGRFEAILSPEDGMVSIRPAPDPKHPAASAWRVFSMKTGKQRAAFRSERGVLDAAVVGGRFIYSYFGPPPPEVRLPPTVAARPVLLLRAVDLETGQRTWWKPLDPSNPFWAILSSMVGPSAGDDP